MIGKIFHHQLILYSSRLKIPEAGYGKPCIAGRLREAEGCHPYRLRYIRPMTGDSCTGQCPLIIEAIFNNSFSDDAP